MLAPLEPSARPAPARPARLSSFYAELAWRLIPIGPDKRPRLKGWPEAASPDPEQWREWMSRWRDAALALATGPASGVLVVDVDAPGPEHEADGTAALARLEEELGPLPPAPTAATPSGGLHFFYRWPPGRDRIPSRPLLPGVDLKASGGLVTLPCGPRTPGRRWLALPGLELGLPELPVRWLARVLPLPPVPRPRPVWRDPPGDRYAAAALRSAADRVAAAAPGTRNATLFKEAASLARLEALAAEAIAARLEEAALAAGLEAREARATIRSALARVRR